MLRHAGDVTKIYLICFAVSMVLPVILINLLGLMGDVYKRELYERATAQARHWHI